jgi:hypothetical protein
MSLRLPDLLALAENARTNPDLLPNHLGTVDRKLREHLAERESVLAAIAEPVGDGELTDSLAELRSRLAWEREAITAALTTYAAKACHASSSTCRSGCALGA